MTVRNSLRNRGISGEEAPGTQDFPLKNQV